MRKVFLFIILSSTFLMADWYTTDKLYVSIEYQRNHDRVMFIEDKETGTRCYAITNSEINVTGYAISCVPKVTR